MTESEIKTLSEQLMTVRLDIKELSTKMDGIKDMQRKVDEIHDTSNQAVQSANIANLRLDKMDKIVFWVSTTVIGSLLISLIAFILKGGLIVK